MLTRQHVAEKLIDYLHHRISLAELVDWAENAMMGGDCPKVTPTIPGRISTGAQVAPQHCPILLSSSYSIPLFGDLPFTQKNLCSHNIYPFHFSDGDNLPSDNENCVRLVKELLNVCNIFGYGEIVNPYYRSSTLMQVYKRIQDSKLVACTIKDKSEVYPALRTFFHRRDGEMAG